MNQPPLKETSEAHTHLGENQILAREGWLHVSTSPNDQSYLIGARCTLCGEVFFPRRLVCPVCVKKDTTKEIRLSERGTVYSYSVMHVSLPGFPAPYIIARVEVPEGPRITALITGCEAAEGVLEIGDEVELVIGKVSEDNDGNDIIGYMYRPVSK